jgi:hypothetical protein
VLFNHPVCPDIVEVYEWTQEGEVLLFTVVDDPCSIKLRAMNLTKRRGFPASHPPHELSWSTEQPNSVCCTHQ